MVTNVKYSRKFYPLCLLNIMLFYSCQQIKVYGFLTYVLKTIHLAYSLIQHGQMKATAKLYIEIFHVSIECDF